MMKHYTKFKPSLDNCYAVDGRKKSLLEVYDNECDDILTFDIEVTSAWIDKNGNIHKYEPGKSEEYWNNMLGISVCYIWQFSYNNVVYYGRELSEFRYILEQLDPRTHYIIYVHNLAYEFQFLCNILEWKQVFARDERKVMYCIPAEFENIEFRCSYFLTRLSLDAWGQELGTVQKLHSLAYSEKIRTPKTRLTKAEMDYCEHDCLVVYEGIKNYLKKYEHVRQIPLTQTGEVRRELKEIVLKNTSLQRQMISLIPDARMYRMLKTAFAGGYTHANFTLADMVINCESGKHYDFASSYPYVMLSEKFPMTYFQEIDTDEDMDTENNAYLLRIRVKKCDAKTYNHYISASKCFECNTKIFYDDELQTVSHLNCDNGRVISNEYTISVTEKVEVMNKNGKSYKRKKFVKQHRSKVLRQKFDMYITEQDLDIIEKTYDIDYEIVELYEARKQYLPIEFIDYILKLYADKTELKQKESDPNFDEVEYTRYMTSKKFINSIFGMSCTDIVHDNVHFVEEYDEEEKRMKRYWTTDEQNIFGVEDELKKMKENNKGKTFMNFSWGVWITAYARHNLWECILAGDDGNNINDIIYCDTDSIFCRADIDFSEYNKNCRVKLQKMCDYYNIDIERTEPRDKKGIKHPLGVFAAEDDWSQFVTLGAKRYCVREKSDNKLHLTVSGINKSAVDVLNDDISNFNRDLIFDKDDENVKKMMLSYTEEQGEIVWQKGKYDEYTSHDAFGINMRNTSYSMSMTDEYFELLTMTNVISHLRCLE